MNESEELEKLQERVGRLEAKLSYCQLCVELDAGIDTLTTR